MSTGISIAIPLGFLLLAGTLCWFFASTKRRWVVKGVLTLFMTFYSLEVHDALDSYSGWPAAEAMPQRALLLSATVREPNPSKNDLGAIFLWVVPLGQDDPGPFAYRPISGEPRAYKLPYSRDMHEQASQAMTAMQRDGRPILIERGARPGGAEGEGEGAGGGNRTTYDDEDGGGFHMRQLEPSLPEKTPQ